MQMEVHNAQLFNMQPVIPGKKNKSPVCTAYNVLAYHKLMIAKLAKNPKQLDHRPNIIFSKEM